MADKLEYNNYINSLFDIYGSLLTNKQIEYFKMYYFDDYSLREIASDLKVSSNAVYDQIKTIEKTLEKYEDNLHVYSNTLNMLDNVEKIENRLKEIDVNDSLINELIEELKK